MQKTSVHLNPSSGAFVAVTATTTKYANKKECLDYYVNPLTKDNCDQTSRNK